MRNRRILFSLLQRLSQDDVRDSILNHLLIRHADIRERRGRLVAHAYGWIQFFLAAVAEQAQVNTKKAGDILSLYERMKVEVPQAIRSQYVVQAIDALFDRPIFTIPGIDGLVKTYT